MLWWTIALDRLRDQAISWRAHDVVVFEFGRFVLLGIRRGILANGAHLVKMRTDICIPVTRQRHEWVTGRTFRDVRRSPGILLICLRNPVIHDGAARIDREAQLITKLARKFYWPAPKPTSRPNDGNRCLVEIFLYICHGALQFTCEEFISRTITHVEVMDETMRLIIHPALFGKRHIFRQKLIVPLKSTDPAINDRPVPLFPIGSKMVVEILGGMTVIYHQQNRTLRDFAVGI